MSRKVKCSECTKETEVNRYGCNKKGEVCINDEKYLCAICRNKLNNTVLIPKKPKQRVYEKNRTTPKRTK